MNLISLVACDLNCTPNLPPYPAPDGFIWEKFDHYSDKNNVIEKGKWILKQIQLINTDQKLQKEIKIEIKLNRCEKCPNRHMEDHFCYDKIGGYDSYQKKEEERKKQIISNTFNSNYHKCNHRDHKTCSASPCCDVFWHEGECNYVSENGGCGLAVIYGDQ
jgi:hypothetical protein